MPDDVLALWTGKSTGSAQSTAAADPPSDNSAPEKKPYSLAWYVLIALLAAALAESVLASRYLDTQQEEL
jgi:hypothetical protein